MVASQALHRQVAGGQFLWLMLASSLCTFFYTAQD